MFGGQTLLEGSSCQLVSSVHHVTPIVGPAPIAPVSVVGAVGGVDAADELLLTQVEG